MNAHRIPYCGGWLLTALACLLAGPALWACAPVPPPGQHVAIAEESAIILWDAASKTQHFIRRASFQTAAQDFGFLVPTPGKPELDEASDEAFKTLERLTAPQVTTMTQRLPRGARAAPMAAAPMPNSVRVLDSKRVAGYDAVVLEADNPEALNQWLKQHGYASRPALTRWLEPYVKAQWKITAFKIAKDAKKEPGVATAAVRMTFQTDRPFFPYREPDDQHEAAKGPSNSRLLRVYFLSADRTAGTLGKAGEWPGRVVWANQLAAPQREQVLQLLKLPDQTPPASWWLTEFEDHAAPRPGTDDVVFSPSENQSPLARPPIINYQYVYADSLEDDPFGYYLMAGLAVLLLLALAGVIIFWRIRARE